MDPAQLAILTLASFATSMLSGMLGLAGGMTLRAVMLWHAAGFQAIVGR